MPGDSIFLRGSTHLICEDYATNEEGFAAVFDGCSSAPRSDVAARLVFLAARQTYHEALRAPSLTCGQLKDLDREALRALAGFEDLYATFVGARVFGSRVLVTAVGDGHLILGRRDGSRERYDFRYPVYNAPYYPAYALDPNAERQWRQTYPGNALSVEVSGAPPAVAPPEPWFTFERPTEDLDFVLVISDGLGSFVDSQGHPVEEASVLEELFAFKNRKGEFLKRRVLRMMDDLRDRGIRHQDDFSAALVTFE